MKRCLLCGREWVRLARSHILPWAFFKNMSSPNELNSMSSSGEGRRLRKALYDDDIICDDCEHNIFAQLDDYAVKIYRDQVNSYLVDVKNTIPVDWKLIVFDSVDRKKLRAFFASLLFRCSVSGLEEFREVSIGDVYESRIRFDLLNDGDFHYVDSIGISLTGEIHEGIILPCYKRFKVNDRVANGYVIQLPHLEFRVSLDQRPNPYDYGSLDLSEIGANGITSLSLSNDHLNQMFSVLRTEEMAYQFNWLKEVYHGNKLNQSRNKEKSR